jgi:hypothetical protein
VAASAAAAPTLSTKRRDPPPWTEKWLTALHWLGLLRTAYSEPQLANAEAQRRAEAFATSATISAIGSRKTSAG